MPSPIITVIMPVHNEEPFVRDAIQSILDQTHEKLELIIIDDYSTDRSVEICKSYADPRIRVHAKTDEPRFLAVSRNIGIRMACGDFITFQDGDDVCAPTRLERQLEAALEEPDRRVVGASIKRIQHGAEQVVVFPETHQAITQGFLRTRNRSTIVGATLFAAKAIFEEFPYRERFDYVQDWDQILRMFESGKIEFYNCQEPLYTYYLRSNGQRISSERLDFTIYCRNCQSRRRKGLVEFESLEAFHAYLERHPLAWLKWAGMKKLTELKRWLH